MKKRVVILIVVFSVLIPVGGLGYALATSDVVPESIEPAPTKDPTGPGIQPILPNPEAGLSDSERQALHEKSWSEFEQRYTAWLSNLDIGKLDLRSLPRAELTASYEAPQPSLRAAVAMADLTVVGSVAGIRPTPFSGTELTLSIEQTLKGQSQSTIVITQAGGLYPTQDWTGVVIGEGGNGAFLLPGDRAILLLQKDERGGTYIQSSSGWYQVVSGLVNSNPLNPWSASVTGETEEAFVEQLRAAMQ